MEVKSLENNRLVISEALTGLGVPRTEFAPLEFLVLASASGLVGEPLLLVNSGSEPVDTFFRTYLVQGYRLGSRLSPGKYLVRIGP